MKTANPEDLTILELKEKKLQKFEVIYATFEGETEEPTETFSKIVLVSPKVRYTPLGVYLGRGLLPTGSNPTFGDTEYILLEKAVSSTMLNRTAPITGLNTVLTGSQTDPTSQME